MFSPTKHLFQSVLNFEVQIQQYYLLLISTHKLFFFLIIFHYKLLYSLPQMYVALFIIVMGFGISSKKEKNILKISYVFFNMQYCLLKNLRYFDKMINVKTTYI
ncbi:hypothetical protein HE1_00216 [Holospora elegans E1]|uniref:Transmembrane protein n=1 Tax=Holospora elegans E1 TaxID=1427503 RepID=A0A023DXP1_9PROT|nr:hypothetical protein HE1_00216 [Holospora elegans E1]